MAAFKLASYIVVITLPHASHVDCFPFCRNTLSKEKDLKENMLRDLREKANGKCDSPHFRWYLISESPSTVVSHANRYAEIPENLLNESFRMACGISCLYVCLYTCLSTGASAVASAHRCGHATDTSHAQHRFHRLHRAGHQQRLVPHLDRPHLQQCLPPSRRLLHRTIQRPSLPLLRQHQFLCTSPASPSLTHRQNSAVSAAELCSSVRATTTSRPRKHSAAPLM